MAKGTGGVRTAGRQGPTLAAPRVRVGAGVQRRMDDITQGGGTINAVERAGSGNIQVTYTFQGQSYMITYNRFGGAETAPRRIAI